MLFNNKKMEAVKRLIETSDYYELLYGNMEKLGAKFKDNSCVIYNIPAKDEGAIIDYYASCDGQTPDLWVEIDESDLINYIDNGIGISSMKIATSERGQVVHPVMERVVERIFMPQGYKYPIQDREEIVYKILFGFNEPEVVWRSEKSDLKVLKYRNAFEELDLYISSGLTNPEMGEPSRSLKVIRIDDEKPSGFGYELMIFAKPGEKLLGDQLTSWVKYVEDTERHIIQGQYLEYYEGNIPNTNLAGFIVVNALTFPNAIPVTDGYGALNMLLGVTKEELEVAKEEDIYEVADLLFESGYINYSPSNRESLA